MSSSATSPIATNIAPLPPSTDHGAPSASHATATAAVVNWSVLTGFLQRSDDMSWDDVEALAEWMSSLYQQRADIRYVLLTCFLCAS